jgi:hypothetical protein
MVCLSVFSRGVLTYIYLVSHILHIFLKYSWPTFGSRIFNYGFSSNYRRRDVNF